MSKREDVERLLMSIAYCAQTTTYGVVRETAGKLAALLVPEEPEPVVGAVCSHCRPDLWNGVRIGRSCGCPCHKPKPAEVHKSSCDKLHSIGAPCSCKPAPQPESGDWLDLEEFSTPLWEWHDHPVETLFREERAKLAEMYNGMGQLPLQRKLNSLNSEIGDLLWTLQRKDQWTAELASREAVVAILRRLVAQENEEAI